ncbi:MAG: flagellar basal-body MS-ring/collar protein FliF [Nitrospinota bacterium]
MNLLIQLVHQFWEVIVGMSAARRTAILLFMGIIISSLIGLMVWSSRPDYQVLYSGLAQDDAGTVMTRLRERRIPYILDGNGTVIKVPSSVLHEMRLALAEENLPSGGGVGFEIFDRSSLGVTDFVQKVNFLRALQGELAKTITHIRSIKSARVHIVMPDRSLFSEEKRVPTASVVVGLSGAARLSKRHVNSIVQLVAGAVEGLESKNVTLVDNRGNILAGGKGDDDADLFSATQQEFEANLEGRMERHIESMLAKVVGVGKVVARVDLDLNMKRVERTREIFDPEKQIERSIRRIKESNQSGAAGTGGVPGVQANVPESERNENVAAASGGTEQKSSRTSETINYEIDKTIERTVEPVGEIRKISVAVMVNGVAGTAPGQFQPRPKAEIDKFKQLVRAAIGANTQRGDLVEIQSVPFVAPPPPEEGEIVPVGQQAFITDMIQYIVGIIALVMIFLFIVRPILSWLTSVELRAAPPSGALAAGMGALALPGLPGAAALLAEPEVPAVMNKEEIQMEEAAKIYDQVYDFVSNNPEETADLLRRWVRESPTSPL